MASRKRAPAADHIILAIEGFMPSYSLSAPMRGNQRFSSEYLTMELDCKCLYPQRYSDWRVHAHFRGDRDYLEELKYLRENPAETPSVAVVTLRRDHSSVYGTLPFDVMPVLTSLIASGFITHITLYGPPPYRGTAIPHNISFERNLDLSEYI
ncbi:hypothetical protein [Hyphomonas sp.]|uniref:hypothetical protein n=1 Tax=Hyphomonas sp. TaxID=87 RepID=UPI0032423CB2